MSVAVAHRVESVDSQHNSSQIAKLRVKTDRIDQRPPTAVGALSPESLKEVDTPLPSHTLWKRDLWDTPGVVS